MTNPLPHTRSRMVSFRCAECLKKQMVSFADTHSLTASEVMRQALEQFMQQPEPDELGDKNTCISAIFLSKSMAAKPPPSQQP